MIFKYLLYFALISYVAANPPRGLLSTKQCTWGPSFWCSNITNAKSCNAVKHCIQAVWEKQKVPEDNDNICDLCKKMVSQARMQLESNDTVDMIKEVFEGSCKLIHIKPLVKECTILADKYAPELVDILSSQMNPGVVCSIAGLCNSVAIDKMLEDVSNKKAKDDARRDELQKDCEPCLDFADVIGDKIMKATQGDIKGYLLERCRSFGSLSDSCSNIVEEYTPDLYEKIKKDFTPSSLCYLTSSCVNGYTRKIQVKTESDVGVIHVNSDAISVAVKHLSEDQTCELCKQLVKHLKDILTANTTEIEFKQVLKGLCKQTGRFKSECLAIADEYYDKIYQFLVNDLDGREICSFAGICARPGVFVNGPIAPLLPQAPVPKGEGKLGRISVGKSDSNVQVFTPFVQSPVRVEISYGDPLESKFQLPIERMVVVSHSKDLNVNNRVACSFCQYLLHYVQKAITQPYGEAELKKVVGRVCDTLPTSMTVECKNFIDEYGDSFVAILAQEIDPSQVCPTIHICPARVLENKYEPLELTGKATCPLCLMAMEDITEKLKENKTEESIRDALKKLCGGMPTSLKHQCEIFVQDYSEEIIDMIIADFTPQEVCTYLKLCKENAQADVELVPPATAEEDHHILTNEIPRDDFSAIKRTPSTCILCEFIMNKVEKRLKDNSTDEEVKRAVLNVCQHLPRSIRSECHSFVEKYSDIILKMLSEMTKPNMICSEMHMCKDAAESSRVVGQVRQMVEDCIMCEAIVGALRGIAEDRTLDANASEYIAEICSTIFNRQLMECRRIVRSYGPSILRLLVELEVNPALICPRVGLCDRTEQAKVVVVEPTTPKSHPQRRPHLVGGNSCTWGPSYWCQSEDHARRCGTLAHCREMVWKSERASTPNA